MDQPVKDDENFILVATQCAGVDSIFAFAFNTKDEVNTHVKNHVKIFGLARDNENQ